MSFCLSSLGKFVSHHDNPYQISKYSDKSLHELKRTQWKKPFKNDDFSSALIPSFNEKHENQNDDDTDK